MDWWIFTAYQPCRHVRPNTMKITQVLALQKDLHLKNLASHQAISPMNLGETCCIDGINQVDAFSSLNQWHKGCLGLSVQVFLKQVWGGSWTTVCELRKKRVPLSLYSLLGLKNSENEMFTSVNEKELMCCIIWFKLKIKT